jgi:hypothetical protein
MGHTISRCYGDIQDYLIYQFRHAYTLDDHGDQHNAMLLETISIKKDGAAFTPQAMRHVKRLEMKKTGVWKVRR